MVARSTRGGDSRKTAEGIPVAEDQKREAPVHPGVPRSIIVRLRVVLSNGDKNVAAPCTSSAMRKLHSATARRRRQTPQPPRRRPLSRLATAPAKPHTPRHPAPPSICRKSLSVVARSTRGGDIPVAEDQKREAPIHPGVPRAIIVRLRVVLSNGDKKVAAPCTSSAMRKLRSATAPWRRQTPHPPRRRPLSRLAATQHHRRGGKVRLHRRKNQTDRPSNDRT